MHELKLTARVVQDNLVLDLSFSRRRAPAAAMVEVLAETRRLLLSLIDCAAPAPAPVVEDGSSTGVLTYAPARLQIGERSPSRHYARVLLTGATGYLGVHLLRALLTDTTAHVVCLVRNRAGVPAAQRLADTYRWYFPDDDLTAVSTRWTVLTSDLTEPGFGLPRDDYEALCTTIDGVYHCAGDTRLFGTAQDFDRCNVSVTRAVVDFASTVRPKDVHHVSTLAVCGVNQTGTTVEFDETSLDIGQQFLNDYELSKYEAEQVIRGFRAGGGSAFVYRAGNVTGASATGRFQRNAGDNRFVLTLRALIRTGRLPQHLGEDLVLDHVDVVADAIVSLSCRSAAVGGTYHVAGDTPVPQERIVAALRAAGWTFDQSDADDLAALFTGSTDPDIAPAQYWAQRPPRDVALVNTSTSKLLTELGVTFTPPDEAWLKAYLLGLAEQGAIPPPTRQPTMVRRP